MNKNILNLMGDGIETYNGLPYTKMIKEQEKPLLLILDDLI
jgi:hypothetical protein